MGLTFRKFHQRAVALKVEICADGRLFAYLFVRVLNSLSQRPKWSTVNIKKIKESKTLSHTATQSQAHAHTYTYIHAHTMHMHTCLASMYIPTPIPTHTPTDIKSVPHYFPATPTPHHSSFGSLLFLHLYTRLVQISGFRSRGIQTKISRYL